MAVSLLKSTQSWDLIFCVLNETRTCSNVTYSFLYFSLNHVYISSLKKRRPICLYVLKKYFWFSIMGYLLVYISFLLSFLVLQIDKDRKELIEKSNYNLRENSSHSDLFKNGHWVDKV
jgi:hypothetical protein